MPTVSPPRFRRRPPESPHQAAVISRLCAAFTSHSASSPPPDPMPAHFCLIPCLLLSILLAARPVPALEPFSTDGCSGFPDGTLARRELWLDCCIEHDKAYWRGGTYRQRLEADRRLHDCVAATGETGIAEIMLEGVRVGGSPFFPTGYRWGYGWPYPRGYAPLTPEEREQVERALRVGSRVTE